MKKGKLIKKLNSIFLKSILILATTVFVNSVYAAPFAFSADGDAVGGNLYQIDLANNSITTIGPITGFRVEAMTVGPNSIIYAATDNTDELITINTTTGAGTVIGSLSPPPSNPGLAYCADNNTMYMVDSGSLYSVNLATANLTLIGTDVNYSGSTGLACSGNGQLYVLNNSSDSLYRVNRTTGAATLVGSLGITISDGGLTFNGSQLLMVSDNSPTNLNALNTSTGAATVLAQLDASGLSLESLTVADLSNAQDIPTLSEWALILLVLSLGLLGFSVTRKQNQ